MGEAKSVEGRREVKDHRLLDGRAVRDRILDEVAERVRQAETTHTIGRLVSVSIGEHKAAGVYVRGQATAATRVGLRFEEQTWPSTLSQDECKARLVAMNDDAGRARRHPAAARPLAHPRPLARLRDPPAQGHRGHEPGVDRQHRLQRPGAGAVHGGGVGGADQGDRPEPARPRGGDGGPLGDRRQAGGVHADGRRAPR